MPSQLLDAIANVIALLTSHLPDQALTTAIDAVSRVLGV
jgi:hypothetical protein